MNDVSEEKEGAGEHQERILIPVSYEKNVTELVNLSTAIKSKKNKNGLFALNVINNQASDDKAFKQSKKVLNMAVTTASATDNVLQDLLRYDLNVANAIISVIKEQGITDLVLGLHQGKGVVSSFLGNMTEAILGQSNVYHVNLSPHTTYCHGETSSGGGAGPGGKRGRFPDVGE